ncbi:class I SAM-dependent methyltransferase [Aliarcobacter cryaerophilus]|uniref:class I SAM-dependent methyltransferase n=1 Tax=Aliarcobacter cryaerophilus TaxID=28198 RepID=UPI003DA562A8
MNKESDVQIKYKNEINYLIKKLDTCNSKLIIYGFNDLGYFIYQTFKNRVIDIVDKEKQSEIIDNISIKSIENFDYNPNDIFVITAINNIANKEIRKTIISKFSDEAKIFSINDYYFDKTDNMARYCPICETHSNYFKSFGFVPRNDALCPNCGSLERHRLSWLFLKDKLRKEDIKDKRMLHIAPEKIFMEKFTNLFKENYLTADLYDKNAKIKMDITNIEYPKESFNYIYCSHVLEHIQDDKKAMRELNRVLKKDGWAILLVPIMTKGPTEEDHLINTPTERMKHYGHPDHVRNYGCDYKERLEESGWEVEVIYAEDFLTPKEIELMGITKAAGEIYFCTKKR